MLTEEIYVTWAQKTNNGFAVCGFMVSRVLPLSIMVNNKVIWSLHYPTMFTRSAPKSEKNEVFHDATGSRVGLIDAITVPIGRCQT